VPISDPKAKPAARYGHTLNIVGDHLYVFGGQRRGWPFTRKGNQFLKDIISFDLTKLTTTTAGWEPVKVNSTTQPNARYGHVCVSKGLELIMYFPC